MLNRILLAVGCVLIGSVGNISGATDSTSRTLQQVVWDIGVVSNQDAQIERDLGEDPLALIQLPETSGWFRGMSGPEMREVNLNVADWFVLDRSGLRGGAFFSVWCDHGELYMDLLQVRGLQKAEGTATVEWAFNGEPFKRGIWKQKDKSILPGDDFPHDSFVRRLASARFMVMKVKGQAGLENPRAVTVKRPENVALVPVPLSAKKADLLGLIQQCENSAS